MYLQSTKKGREAKNRLLDLKLVILFCAGSLPTNLASQWYWKDLWALADPKYPLPLRDQIENKLIPAEQASINDIQLKALRNEWNLTISFDGGTTTGREAFWTINVSDMRRNVYLLEGKEATSVSHTAAWIKDFAMSVSKEQVGCERFTGATSDSTGNTHLCKKLIVQDVRMIIASPDVCHYFSNLLKDIVRIDFFALTIKVIRGTINFFHTSHMGIYEFKLVQSDLGIRRELQAIGKTRFGMIIYSSSSVRCCTPAIQKVIERGKVDFSVHKGGTYYSPLFLAAAYLNPANLRSDVFKPEAQPLRDQSLHGVRYPTLHKSVGTYLGKLAAKEIRSDEMLLYSQNQFPYNAPIDENRPLAVMKWFESLTSYSDGQLLPHIAIKVYAVRVNSMPEEWTVSKFTAMSPKQWSQLKVSTMTAITQVSQYYANQHNVSCRNGILYNIADIPC
ncbi:hypothetical protein EV421DRAFT_2081612 [Armillaria borealis]|uniref:DUF659 domain-containing protein n=1 Tax=Armillaria borealis TaxID=47425 RepID=A0AA39JIP4_9AGAR|nr:hypothetical protein EV421DRAFT_2081611 [Armillaria borealis]KAK0443500.1 hypothetical protein EV421DRAFT_2081612 [Armillaria borealis]